MSETVNAINRSSLQRFKDFLFFPIRAVTLFEVDKWGLSSLATERFDYVSRHVKGYCLDVGCGKNNLFIMKYCNGNGKGIDVFLYEGLTEENIIEDVTKIPLEEASFETITFIACINHIPEGIRDSALSEAYRLLKPGGNVIITMGNPLAEILVHKVVALYDRIFKTNYDMDTERGMEEDEDYYLLDSEIVSRAKKAGFGCIKKHYFGTQWALNHLFVGHKSGSEKD